MNNTKIEWCDSTWNPVTGCLHGCEYCYARKIATRFGGYDRLITYTVPKMKGKVAVLDYPAEKGGKTAPYPLDFRPTFYRYLLDKPQHWKKPHTIFVCSMADLFGEWVSDELIEDVFAACEKAPQHRYLFLTKNPERYVKLHEAGKLPDKENMWYGTTVTNPDTLFFGADNHYKFNTFLSIEPILVPFVFSINFPHNRVKWVIIGAETGNRKDKAVPKKEWVDNICKTADLLQIPVFMKDSLLPIIGEENMRREFPWGRLTSNQKSSK